MTRPTDDIEWATDGGASVTEPPALKKTQGWILAEKPPAAWLNWLLRALWRWIDFLDVRMTVAHNDDGTHKTAVITLANMADLAADRIIGRANGAGTGAPTALTANDLSAMGIAVWVAGYDIDAACTLNADTYQNQRRGNTRIAATADSTQFSIDTYGTGKYKIILPTGAKTGSYTLTVFMRDMFRSFRVIDYGGGYWDIWITDLASVLTDSDWSFTVLKVG